MDDLLSNLDAVKKVANASKVNRFFARPLKYVYAILFNKLVYPVSQKGILKKTDTFFGLPLHVLLPAGTDIFLAGGKTHDSEIRLARFLIRQLKPGDTFVDIGAHFGYFSLLASRLVGPGKIYAFEASENTFEVLKKNVAAVENIYPLHRAVSDASETIEFYELPVVYSEYNTMELQQFEDEAWYLKVKPEKKTVAAVALDDFLKESASGPAVIKIDVEGAELKVIRGGAKYLGSHSPVVIMEYLEHRRNNRNHKMAIDLLRELHYRPHSITVTGDLAPCEDIDARLLADGLESDNIVFTKNNFYPSTY